MGTYLVALVIALLTCAYNVWMLRSLLGMKSSDENGGGFADVPKVLARRTYVFVCARMHWPMPIAGDIERLGTRVQIQHGKGGKGKLVLSYGSLEELDGILGHIQ